MKNFRQRTIALILASTLTVAGSFAAEKYKNSIMHMDFEQGTNGAVTMILRTQKDCQNNINLIKKDAATYVMILPEFSNNAPTPDFRNTRDIVSVDVQTRPYTSYNNGYTKITIRTNGKASIFPEYKLYIPKTEERYLPENSHYTNQSVSQTQYTSTTAQNKTSKKKRTKAANSTYADSTASNTQNQVTKNNTHTYTPVNEHRNSIEVTETTEQIPKKEEKYSNVSIWSLVIIIGAIIGSIYLYITGREKLAGIVGNNISIDLKEEEEEEQKKKQVQKNKKNNITERKENPHPAITKINKQTEQIVVEKMSVIDMDELFTNSQNNNTIEKNENHENKALEDFLNSYYSEQKEEEKSKEKISINEEAYNDVFQNKNLKFSQQDIDKINVILNNEITEDIKKQLKNNVVTNSVKIKKELSDFENIVMDYFTRQNVLFNSDDIKIIQNLMSIELDNDFITDLRTNIPKPNNTSVSGGNKQIQKNNESTEERNYNVSILKVDCELPDLQDILAHPEKYEEKKEDTFVDENALLQTLSNVQFKPFYSEEKSPKIAENIATQETSATISKEDKTPAEKPAIENNSKKSSSDNSQIITVDNIVYDIQDVAYFNNNAGVYLTTCETKAVVFGFIEEQITKLKEYDSLKSKKISVRVNEKMDTATRYLVKTGLKKFIVDFDGSNITYVMNLC